MAPGAQLNSPLPAMGSSDPTPLPPPASSQASEPLRGLRRYKMINLVGDGTYGLVYLAYNVISCLVTPEIIVQSDNEFFRSPERRWRSKL